MFQILILKMRKLSFYGWNMCTGNDTCTGIFMNYFVKITVFIFSAPSKVFIYKKNLTLILKTYLEYIKY